MSRWRPPQPKSSPHITPQGYFSLEKELKEKWTFRAEVVQALSAAAAEGDRSENAEYIYRKKQIAEIDRRIRYLQKRMPDLNVIASVANKNQIFFGAWTTLEKEDGSEVEYRIVGADEIESDASKGYISVDSPLGRALLKKEVDDEVVLDIGGNKATFFVVRIRYE
ncbi:MAG: transcription elongation factor GreB [Arenicellales bacterium WSBS_2016_MAG_OTU3]